MTDSNLTPQTIATYLGTWPAYQDVVTMFNQMGEYLNAINERREAWEQVIPVMPDGSEWGNNHRRNNFHTVADFLYRQGLIIGMPEFVNKIDPESDACRWALSKCNGKLGDLNWSAATKLFYVTGMPRPHDEQDAPIAIPSCLIWS
jgi:hypothetical protein